ncbi:MAG: Plug domain-containing protein [Ignavibacteriales bacterium]|nr:Plug domain-containing protein [Ignavibacteriales bacterium]
MFQIIYHNYPQLHFYSENGNGIGYNYLSIRGFDQRRISVSINGIPQNDPEDHNVYWLDFPDLLASTELDSGSAWFWFWSCWISGNWRLN